MTETGANTGTVRLPHQRGTGTGIGRTQPQPDSVAPTESLGGDILVVRSWGREMAIALDHVARVAQLPALTAIPGNHRAQVGVVRFEAHTVAVADLGMLLDIVPTGRYTLDHTLIILESGGRQAGIVVEPDVDLLNADADREITPLASDHAVPLVAILSAGTRQLPVVDVPRLVALIAGAQ